MSYPECRSHNGDGESHWRICRSGQRGLHHEQWNSRCRFAVRRNQWRTGLGRRRCNLQELFDQISDATPFSGSKAFSVALSSPGGGSSLSTPSNAVYPLPEPAGRGAGGPSAVTNLQLINEGGPNSANLGGTTLTNHQEISWDAASPGANPIASYNIYRNGVLYANTTALTYTDDAATNGVVPTWSAPATIYRYNVAAVDTQGNVGPQAAQMTLWGYHNGARFGAMGQ